jgi:hypothetical protein
MGKQNRPKQYGEEHFPNAFNARSDVIPFFMVLMCDLSSSSSMSLYFFLVVCPSDFTFLTSLSDTPPPPAPPMAPTAAPSSDTATVPFSPPLCPHTHTQLETLTQGVAATAAGDNRRRPRLRITPPIPHHAPPPGHTSLPPSSLLLHPNQSPPPGIRFFDRSRSHNFPFLHF